VLPLALKSEDFLEAEIAGAAVGIALAYWGSRRTRYQSAGGQVYYVPHTYTGIAVSLLFVGRIAYRLVTDAQLIGTANAGTDAPDVAPPQMMQSPMTVGVFFVLIAYYICFYAWLFWKSKHLKPEDLEEPRGTTLS
jgi:cytochrome b561